MINEVFIDSIEGIVRRAQAYANIYEQVGFKPFYLSDFNDAVDYDHQVSPSMMSVLHRSHLARKTGNKREYKVFLGEWGGIEHFKKGYSNEWQLEFDSTDANALQSQISSIILELKRLHGSIADAHVEALELTH